VCDQFCGADGAGLRSGTGPPGMSSPEGSEQDDEELEPGSESISDPIFGTGSLSALVVLGLASTYMRRRVRAQDGHLRSFESLLCSGNGPSPEDHVRRVVGHCRRSGDEVGEAVPRRFSAVRTSLVVSL
jgi:hypothetical protein